MTLKRSFAAVVDARTRVLVLGSLPGERSLAEQRYYAHPQNRFWTLIGAVVGEDLAAVDYGERLERLKAHRIGLWDVVASARREGSLDSAIRDHAVNDLAELMADLPDLRAVAFNGQASAAMARRQRIDFGSRALIVLPSSSPAYTAPLAQKQAAWMQLQEWLA